jgi:hypothetical protein
MSGSNGETNYPNNAYWQQKANLGVAFSAGKGTQTSTTADSACTNNIFNLSGVTGNSLVGAYQYGPGAGGGGGGQLGGGGNGNVVHPTIQGATVVPNGATAPLVNVTGTNGGDGASAVTYPFGFGGGGGAGAQNRPGGNGGNGSLYGAGGGGGGSIYVGAATGDRTGNGGNGATGIAIITTYF